MYSIDTNLVMGVLNSEDHLHKAACSFCKNQQDEVYLLASVLVEFKSKYLRYYNDALSDILKIINSNDSIRSKRARLHVLARDDSKLKNFYKIIIKQLDNDFSFNQILRIKSDVIKIINNTAELIAENLGIKITPALQAPEPIDAQKKFVKQSKKFVFSDSDDRNIFIEFIYLSFVEDLKEFYSNDKTFISQAKRELQTLNMPSVRFFRLVRKNDSPFYGLT